MWDLIGLDCCRLEMLVALWKTKTEQKDQENNAFSFILFNEL